MEVRIAYSKSQFESAVDYISANNNTFYGQRKEIEKTLLECIHSLAADRSVYAGTMGFILIPDWTLEGIDSDENICRVGIYVDPSLSVVDDWDDDWDDDYQEEVINILPEGENT